MHEKTEDEDHSVGLNIVMNYVEKRRVSHTHTHTHTHTHSHSELQAPTHTVFLVNQTQR